MDAHRQIGLTLEQKAATGNYLKLAVRALSELSDREQSGIDHSQFMETFCQAFCAEDAAYRDRVLAHMRKSGITDEEIIDRIIPSAARWIGEKWVRDEMNFAQVTIGAARMQELSRVLGSQRSKGFGKMHFGLTVLLIIPREEQHSMGAFVAAEQFRRDGLWVHMAIGQNTAALERTIASDQFSMIGISAGSRKSVEPVKNIVDVIKQRNSTTPVVLGGNVLNLVDNPEQETGADYATSYPAEAMKLSGLTDIRAVLTDKPEVV